VKLKLGAAVLGVYAAAVSITLIVAGHPVLPLFESIGPPASYQYVNPPPALAPSNVKPKENQLDVPFQGGQSLATGLTSSDNQFTVNLAKGAIPPHGNDVVHAVITPLDPGTLAPLPAGVCPNGNAYRITLTYKPSGASVADLTAAGDVILSTPHNANGLIYSLDGQAWQKIAFQLVGGPTTIGNTSFTKSGIYLATTAPLGGKCPNGTSTATGGGVGTALLAVWVGVGALVLGLVGFAVFRRRAAPGPGRGAAAKPAGRHRAGRPKQKGGARRRR